MPVNIPIRTAPPPLSRESTASASSSPPPTINCQRGDSNTYRKLPRPLRGEREEMPPPKNLPGFYFDPEKNRYFPVKGPIPGSKRPLPSSSSSSDPSSSSRDDPDQKNQVQLTRWKRRIKGSELLRVREIHGGLIFSNKTRCSFRQEYQKVQASRPMVWNYQSTTNVADAAVEQLSGIVQTPSGSRETKFLTAGNMMGAISLFGIGNVLADFCYGDETFIRPIWSPSRNQKAIYDSAIWSTWCTAYPSFTSNISCIRKLGNKSPNPVDASSSYQHALYPKPYLVLYYFLLITNMERDLLDCSQL